MGIIYLILKRDFHAMPRHRWYYFKRVLVISILGFVIVLSAYNFGGRMTMTTAGLALFSKLSYVSLLLLAFMPYMVASEFNDELENNTLGLLLMSNVPVFFALISRVLSSFVNALFALVSLLPLLILCVSMGGISFGQIVGTVIILLSTLIFTVCFGCMCSVRGAGGKKTSMFVSTGVFLYLAFPWLLNEIMAFLDGIRYLDILEYFYIFSYLAMDVNLGNNIFDSPDDFLRIIFSCVFHLAMAIFCLLIAWRHLPGVLSGDGRKGAVSTANSKGNRRKKPIVFDQQNPIYVMEFYKRYGGWGWTLTKLFLIFIPLLFICYVNVSRWMGFWRGIMEALAMTTAILGVLLFFLSLSRAGNIFTRERKSGGFQILLSATLDEKDYIKGKMKALIFLFLPMISLIILLLIMIFIHQSFSRYISIWVDLLMVMLFFGFGVIALFNRLYISVCLFLAYLYLHFFLEFFNSSLGGNDFIIMSMFLFLVVGMWLMLCSISFLYAIKVGRFGQILMPIIATAYIWIFIAVLEIFFGGFDENAVAVLFFFIGLGHLMFAGKLFQYLTLNFRELALNKEDL